MKLANLTPNEIDPAQVECCSTTCDGSLRDGELLGAGLLHCSRPTVSPGFHAPGRMLTPWGLGSREGIASLLSTPLVSKFIAYFQVGAVCALLDIAAFWVLLQLTDLKYLSFGISFVISTGVNYYLTVLFVFARPQRRRETTIALVYVASAIAVGINLSFFSAAIEVFGIHPVLAKMLGAGAGFGWNFTSKYAWIFRA